LTTLLKECRIPLLTFAQWNYIGFNRPQKQNFTKTNMFILFAHFLNPIIYIASNQLT